MFFIVYFLFRFGVLFLSCLVEKLYFLDLRIYFLMFEFIFDLLYGHVALTVSAKYSVCWQWLLDVCVHIFCCLPKLCLFCWFECVPSAHDHNLVSGSDCYAANCKRKDYYFSLVFTFCCCKRAWPLPRRIWDLRMCAHTSESMASTPPR